VGVPIGSNLTVASFTPDVSGYYYLTGMDNNGCQVDDSIYLSPLNPPSISIDSLLENLICVADTIHLSANGNGVISWSGPNGLSELGNSLILENLSILDSGWYHASITDVHGCSNSDSVYLSVSSAFVELDLSDTSICPGMPFSMEFTSSNMFWSGPQSYYSSTSNLTITNPQIEHQGWYTASWIDNNGCQGSDSLWLEIESNMDCMLIPELVTPNEDGMNDNWNITGFSGYSKASIAIHNRWGALVFQEEPFSGQWNLKGNRGWVYQPEERIPTGTYYYILHLNDDSQTILTGFFDVQY
jgi:gliding motility-associated-like protein